MKNLNIYNNVSPNSPYNEKFFKQGRKGNQYTRILRSVTFSLRVKEQRNILHKIRKRKANWIGHILRRNCLLQRVIKGKIKGGI
jgi:hypothetical protein